jgi:hypothetical protein
MTNVRINLKEVEGAAKVDLLHHYEIQARKAARRLRTALAKWQITRKGIEGAVDGKSATVQPLATELIKWINDAIDWSKTADLDAKPESKKKTKVKGAPAKAPAKKVAKPEAKKTPVKKSDAKASLRADAQLKAKKAVAKKGFAKMKDSVVAPELPALADAPIELPAVNTRGGF